MPKTPAQSTKQFTFKPGVGGFPPWAGFNSAEDPTAIKPNQLTEAINVTADGSGGLQERGGQAQICTLTGKISGIFDPTVYLGL